MNANNGDHAAGSAAPANSKCLFCDLSPGSPEHVFLSALGGRLITKAAVCQRCNNHFAQADGDKIDDALAGAFELIRCALRVNTGRGGSPPTIYKAGLLADGSDYDLGLGLVPLSRASPVPKFSGKKPGDTLTSRSRSIDEANRILDIARQCGTSPVVQDSTMDGTSALPTERTINFGGPKILRSLAKTAATGSCVLFGNRLARAHLDPKLLKSIKTGAPEIEDYAGWDYTSDWPGIVSMTPHANTVAKLAEFPHSLMLLDVENDWVGYLVLFRTFRFSVRLGPRSGLDPKALALNPGEPGRFAVSVKRPPAYKRRARTPPQDELHRTYAGLTNSVSWLKAAWESRQTAEHEQREDEERTERLAYATDEASRTNIIAEWERRRAHVGRWANVFSFPAGDETTPQRRSCERCSSDMTRLRDQTWFCSKCGYQGRPLPVL